MTGATRKDSAETATVTIGGREITVIMPTEDQLVVLGGLIDKLAYEGTEPTEEQKADMLESVQLYGDFVTSLMVERADRSWCARQVMSRRLPPGVFSDFLADVMKAFQIEQAAPVANRAARRARPARAPK